jgi:hypothetical protein
MAFNAKLDSIDKYFFGVHESLAFERIYESHDTEELSRLRDELEQISDANYRTLYDRYKGCKRAFVLGTGPSLQSALRRYLTMRGRLLLHLQTRFFTLGEAIMRTNFALT